MTAALNGTAADNGQAEKQLFPSHQTELVDGSGLTLDTIKAAGIYSSGDHPALAAILNRRSYPRTYGAALVFPYLDESGATVLQRVKPTHPPRRKGKPLKYISPTGSTVRVYFPPDAWKAVNDPKGQLFCTEGEKKALALTQAGFNCLGLSGVDCWHPGKSSLLLPDLDRIKWQGREVFIVFDSDAVDNEQVKINENLLAATLGLRGAKVKIVRLPGGDDDEKVGADDYLVKHGASKFGELVRKAEDPEPIDAGELRGSANECDPAIEATHIIAGCKLGEVSKLIYWRGTWWWWASGCYVNRDREEVRSQIVNSMNQRWLNVKGRHVSDVIEHLLAKSILSSTIDPPSWLCQPFAGFEATECLATKNEIVHLPSLVDRCEIYSAPATPAFFTTTACSFNLDPQAPRPDAWLSFLDSLWGDDPQNIEALQQWFGYLLTSDTRQQKMLLIVGPKRSGKGTLARVLTALVGKENVAAPTLGGLATNFGLWPLIGKSVAIISDARLSGRADQAAVVERLLSISGEDSITIDRKNLQPITCRLSTRFVILTNELPKLSDASGAIVSRMILLHTRESFLGREDHDLTDKLLEELPGILLWAIEGWRRLRGSRRLIQPEGGLDSLGEMDDLASPVSAFVRERCNLTVAAITPVADIFAAWKSWCLSQGRENYSGNVQTFGRDLLAAESRIQKKQVRTTTGRIRAYEGVELKTDF